MMTSPQIPEGKHALKNMIMMPIGVEPKIIVTLPHQPNAAHVEEG
jgi:hypothetical protein